MTSQGLNWDRARRSPAPHQWFELHHLQYELHYLQLGLRYLKDRLHHHKIYIFLVLIDLNG